MKAIGLFFLFICLSSLALECVDARRSNMLRRRKRKGFFENVKKGAERAVDAVGGAVKDGVKAVEKGVEGLVDIGKKLLDKIKALASEAKDKLMGFLSKAIDFIKEKFNAIPNKDDFGVSLLFSITGQFKAVPNSPIASKMLMKSVSTLDAVVVSLALEWTDKTEKMAVEFANANSLHIFAYIVLDANGSLKNHKLPGLCFPNTFVFGFNLKTLRPEMVGEGDFTKLPSLDCLKKLLTGALANLPGIKEILAIPGAKKLLGI